MKRRDLLEEDSSEEMIMFFLVLVVIQCLFLIQAELSSNNNSVVCNPSNKYLFGPFLLFHFSKARAEFNMSDALDRGNHTDLDNFNYKTAVEKILLRFYSFSNGVNVYFHSKYLRPIPYAKLQFTEDNLATEYIANISKVDFSHQAAQQRRNPSYQIAAKTQIQLELILSTMVVNEAEVDKHGLTMRTLLDSPISSVDQAVSVPVVTFVRDPLSRFLHGYEDSVNRLIAASITDKKPIEFNEELLKFHLIELLNFNTPLSNMPASIYPLAGLFFEFQVGIVGQTEHFARDWQAVVAAFHLPASARRLLNKNEDKDNKNSNKNNKNSNKNNNKNNNKNSAKSTDSNNSSEVVQHIQSTGTKRVDNRRVLFELLEKNNHYLRAICHLILVDYVCLSAYSLPEGCQFLTQARDNAVAALSRNEFLPAS